MRGAIEIFALAGAGLLPIAAYLAIGLWMLRALGEATRGTERLALAFVLGTGAASLAILILRSLDAPVPLPALAVVGASAFLVPGLREPSAVRPERASRWARTVDAITVALVASILVAAFGPEVSWDALEYHLPIVAAWTDGPIRALPGMLDAEFRVGVGLLYVPAIAAGQPDAAAAISAAFAIALAALVRAEARRRTSPGAGACAGLLVLLAPITVSKATTAEVDLAVGAYGFVALIWADRWTHTGARRALTISAVSLAFAANAKLHAAALIPAALVLVALGGRRPSARTLFSHAMLVAVLVAPWLVKSALTTGNPFFPLLGEWLGYGPTTADHLAHRQWRLAYDLKVGRNVVSLAQYVASMSLGRTPEIGGLAGPLPLALLPLAVMRRLSRATLLLVVVLAALFVLQFVFMPALRFGTPILPFLALGAAAGGTLAARRGGSARAVLVAGLLSVAAWQLGSAVSGLVPRIAAIPDPAPYERSALPDQDSLRRMVERAEPVVGIHMGAVAWMPKPVYNLHWERNGEIFLGRMPPEQILSVLEQRGVRSLVLQVREPLPPDGTVNQRTVDAWIRSGRASRQSDSELLRARGDRVWVLVELH
jgi:hypothetical protein